jgi:23S rRNA pseudouridine1911/1915/1917 synthase
VRKEDPQRLLALLEFHRPPWNEPEAPESFDVAFEDEHVLVLVKPAGLQVLPAGPFSARTLLELVRASHASRAEAAPAHRLGAARPASSPSANGRGRSSLARQFREFVQKTYLAWSRARATARSRRASRSRA